MAMTRKRRLLLAALVAIGILFTWSLSQSVDSPNLYACLLRHPSAITPARHAFTLVGKRRAFDRQLAMAEEGQIQDTLRRLKQLAERERPSPHEGPQQLNPPHE
jgi:hypothetical protein